LCREIKYDYFEIDTKCITFYEKNADILVIIAGGSNCRPKGNCKGKGEFHSRTRDDGPEGE
jgi:hypothetical protein